MLNVIKTAVIILFAAIILACSTGLYRRIDSSAPSFGPIFADMTRAEAEMHLGPPIMIAPIGEGQYRGIYEYEIERDVKDTIYNDVMDFVTSGMGILIVSPVDRFKGTRHLIAVLYEMKDQYEKNDRVVDIEDRFQVARKK